MAAAGIRASSAATSARALGGSATASCQHSSRRARKGSSTGGACPAAPAASATAARKVGNAALTMRRLYREAPAANPGHRSGLVFAAPAMPASLMCWRLAFIVVLASSLAVACATEKRSEDEQLLAEQRPGGVQGGAPGTPGPGTEPPGSQPPAGGVAGQPPAAAGGGGGGSWIPPRADCTPSTPSIYYTGILLDMTSGEATCSRQILVCGDSVRTDRRYNFNKGERCPWGGERAAIAGREDGMPVCCDDWERAKVSKSPCDPLADADCDGSPNDEDVETLNATPLAAR